MAPSKEPCTFGGAIINTFFLCITFFMDHPCRKVLTLRILDVLCAQHVSPPFASLLFVPHPTLPLKAAWTYHVASLDMPGQASSPVPPALDKHPAQKARAVFPCPAFVFHPHASHVLLFFGRWLSFGRFFWFSPGPLRWHQRFWFIWKPCSFRPHVSKPRASISTGRRQGGLKCTDVGGCWSAARCMHPLIIPLNSDMLTGRRMTRACCSGHDE